MAITQLNGAGCTVLIQDAFVCVCVGLLYVFLNYGNVFIVLECIYAARVLMSVPLNYVIQNGRNRGFVLPNLIPPLQTSCRMFINPA